MMTFAKSIFCCPQFKPKTPLFMKISTDVEGYWLDKKLDFSAHTVTNYEQ